METGTRALIGRRYRIQGRLGKGGMGEVWSALDLLTKQKLALKQLALNDLISPVSTPNPTPNAETTPGFDAPTKLDAGTSGATVPEATPSPRITDSSQALRLALTQEF